MTRPLPTEPGSVIGWTGYYDGVNYGSAVLDWGDNETPIAWWQGGFPEFRTAAQMAEIVGDHWEFLGKITICPFLAKCEGECRHTKHPENHPSIPAP